MAYKHGVYSIVGEPVGEAVVSSDTALVVVGSCKTLASGSIVMCTSYDDFTTKCGAGADGEYTCQDCAKYAFDEARLAEVVFISAGTDVDGIASVATKIRDIPLAVNRKPGLVVAPSADATAIGALVAGATDIEGNQSYNAFVLADLEGDSVSGLIAAKANVTPAKNLAVFGGRISVGDRTVTAALAYACEQVIVDSENGGIPFEGASNRRVRCTVESIEPKIGRVDGNQLNSNGINTFICDGGETLIWGAYLSPYTFGQSVQPDEIFICTQRMIDNRRRGFLGRWARIIDQGFTRQLRDTIMVREQAELDRLVSIGALVGNPRIEFRELDNPNSEILQGNFVWQMQISPAIPLVSATLKVSFTDSGYSVVVGG